MWSYNDPDQAKSLLRKENCIMPIFLVHGKAHHWAKKMPLKVKECSSKQKNHCSVKNELLNCQRFPPEETVVLLTTSKIQTGDSFTMQIPNISQWWTNRMKILSWIMLMHVRPQSYLEEEASGNWSCQFVHSEVGGTHPDLALHFFFLLYRQVIFGL